MCPGDEVAHRQRGVSRRLVRSSTVEGIERGDSFPDRDAILTLPPVVEDHDGSVEHLGFLRRALIVQQPPGHDEDQVECREPLLAVYEKPVVVRVLVVHKGTKEVRRVLLAPTSSRLLIARVVVVLLAQVLHEDPYVVLGPCVLALVIVDCICSIATEKSRERVAVTSDLVSSHSLVPAVTILRVPEGMKEPVSH